ncbi:MarR family winged helix-turn-helix transcriptional regulator [Cryptosporangium phraense]|uniref:MarR family transcriptional regulator n=1 Tax=Cryptosporangium phraense TaxID=2593070 RepID=A0A545AVF4_9ACTN|nr:MarR family transcriptional regulator [Cryptosporangium phraense]TQS45318.1 MarR family transcriptional regulator [Cryptosporangium phraense]
MPDPPGVTMRLGLLLRQSHRRAAGALADVLSELDLTNRHFGVLLILDRDGVSTQRDLIRETGSDKAGMVRTVEELEKRGYLTRSTSAFDRRVADLTLTEPGQAVFDQARRGAAKTAEALFNTFDQEELAALEDLLTRFLAATGPDE